MKATVSFLILALTLPLTARAKMNPELSKYIKLTQTMNEQLLILKEAGKCGNIGSRVAESMDKGIQDLKNAKEQVTEPAKRGSAGRGEVEKAVSAAEKDFHQIHGHKGMVLWGLDGDEAPCKSASHAFTTLHDLSARVPDQLRKVSASL